MTELLKEAFAQAEKLSREDQDAFARWVLEELGSERRWSDLFATSQQKLSDLAAEATEEYRSGRTKPLDPGLL